MPSHKIAAVASAPAPIVHAVPVVAKAEPNVQVLEAEVVEPSKKELLKEVKDKAMDAIESTAK